MGECNGPERGRWRTKAKELFVAVLAENPGQFDAANNLARLLLSEENRPEQAFAGHVARDTFARPAVATDTTVGRGCNRLTRRAGRGVRTAGPGT